MVCKNKGHTQQQNTQAQTTELMASCEPSNKERKNWLVDGGCTRHMTVDAIIFKSIDNRFHSKVKVGNGQYIKAIGKGDVLIKTPLSTKLVTDARLVLYIDQNLLSLGK
ncbi:Integrase, catalytic core [Gossypium australe]|uniref:Integrase, catalytic core n=1 Tax=Gossypium australe TaxID=47621 RepID=A0A5B6WHB2_9ROSI|nr:Integrase, catalytic core [Gossypium australe]